MTRIRITQLVWDKWNIEHIKKHNVTQTETEKAISNVNAHKQGHSGRIVLIGKAGTRILAVILRKLESAKYYVVTARDADKKERRLLYEKEDQQNSNIYKR